MKNGWVEKQQRGRVEAALKAEFRLLSSPETKRLLSQDCYRQTNVKTLSRLGEKSPFYRAINKDLFQGDLVLLSQNPLSKGDGLEVVLHLPQYRTPLGFLAEVTGVETTLEMGRNLFHGALQVLAIHKDDVERLAQSRIQNQMV